MAQIENPINSLKNFNLHEIMGIPTRCTKSTPIGNFLPVICITTSVHRHHRQPHSVTVTVLLMLKMSVLGIFRSLGVENQIYIFLYEIKKNCYLTYRLIQVSLTSRLIQCSLITYREIVFFWTPRD